MPFTWFWLIFAGFLPAPSWAAETETPAFFGVQAADSSYPFKLLCDQTFSISDENQTCNVGLFDCGELKPKSDGNILFNVQNADGTLRSYDFDADMKRRITALYQGKKKVETAVSDPTGDHELGRPVCNLANEAETTELGGSCGGASSYLGFKCFGGNKDNADYVCYDLQPADQDMGYFRGLYVQTVKEFYKQVKQEVGEGISGIPTLTLKTPACQEFARALENQYKSAMTTLRSSVTTSEGLDERYCQATKPKNEVLAFVSNPDLWKTVEDPQVAAQHRLDPPDIRATHMLALSHEFAALYFDLIACEAEGRTRQYFSFHLAANADFLNRLYGFEALACRNMVYKALDGDDHSPGYLQGFANRCWTGQTDSRFGFKAMIKNVYYDYFFNITQTFQGQRPDIYDPHVRDYRKGGRSCHLDLDDWSFYDEAHINDFPDMDMYFRRYSLRDQSTYPWILPWMRTSFGADEWEFRGSHPTEDDDEEMVIREYSTYFPGPGAAGTGCRDMFGILMTGEYKDKCCKDGRFLSQPGCPNYMDETISGNIEQWIRHLEMASDSLEQLRDVNSNQFASATVKIGATAVTPTVKVSEPASTVELPKLVEFSGDRDTGSVSLAVAGNAFLKRKNQNTHARTSGSGTPSAAGKTDSEANNSSFGQSFHPSEKGFTVASEGAETSKAEADVTKTDAGYAQGRGGSQGEGVGSGASEMTGTQSGVELLGASGPGEIDPIQGEDPENYFQRTQAESSLFKNVEKVYRKKTIDWKRTDLKGSK